MVDAAQREIKTLPVKFLWSAYFNKRGSLFCALCALVANLYHVLARQSVTLAPARLPGGLP
jgi:hypothetical protein